MVGVNLPDNELDPKGLLFQGKNQVSERDSLRGGYSPKLLWKNIISEKESKRKE